MILLEVMGLFVWTGACFAAGYLVGLSAERR